MMATDRKKLLGKELAEKYGEVIGNADLRFVLGYKSFSSFNRAVRKNQVGINIFEIENRRGKFALTKDIEEWLEALKEIKSFKQQEES